MQLLAKHPYIKTERKLTSTLQYEVEHNRYIFLYNEKVVTEHREFPINEVMDFSYRKLTNQGGILYLHTTHGVYSYIVESSPQDFIEIFRIHFK